MENLRIGKARQEKKRDVSPLLMRPKQALFTQEQIEHLLTLLKSGLLSSDPPNASVAYTAQLVPSIVTQGYEYSEIIEFESSKEEEHELSIFQKFQDIGIYMMITDYEIDLVKVSQDGGMHQVHGSDMEMASSSTYCIISETEAEPSAVEIASWVHPRNFLSASKAGSNSQQANVVNPEMGLANISMVSRSHVNASQSEECNNRTSKARSLRQFTTQSDHLIASKALRPKQSKKMSVVPKTKRKNGSSQTPVQNDKNSSIFINGRAIDFSGLPAPVCSCTGVRRQCYRWGNGGWQSSCCTTSISEYPLPMSLSRPGARLAGRKMSNGAYGKLIQSLATEGYDFSRPVDLKNHWARHGTNKFVTISIISEPDTEASAMDFMGWVNQTNLQSASKAATNSAQVSCVNAEVGITHVPMLPVLPGNVSQSRELENRTTNIGNQQPSSKRPKSNCVPSKALRPKQSKKTKRKCNSNDKTKREKKNTSIIVNGTMLDLAGAPAPVCSCTGMAHQCYRWGDGGWQSSCCTTSISEYPLPLIPSKSGARVAGRKMSNGAYMKLLQRLIAEGYDLSRPVDLKNHWARHGTNKFVTIR
ncbi:hypothetical protein ACLOJK_034426 [Asimina triloba]